MGALAFKFDSRKTAQAVAFLLRKSRDGKTSKGFLVKMLYGADKRQIRQTGIPLTGDTPYSMESGPVLSTTLNLLGGERSDVFWEKHISKSPKGDTSRIQLIDESIGDDLLSQSEKESLTKAWEVFGGMTWKQVVAFCHDPKNFPEWEDPGKSRKLITFEKLYSVVDRRPELADEIAMLDREDALIEKLVSDAKACAS